MADVVEAWVACPMTSYHSLAWNSSVTSGAQMKNPNPNTWYLATLPKKKRGLTNTPHTFNHPPHTQNSCKTDSNKCIQML
jgi:hypothetical protein